MIEEQIRLNSEHCETLKQMYALERTAELSDQMYTDEQWDLCQDYLEMLRDSVVFSVVTEETDLECIQANAR